MTVAPSNAAQERAWDGVEGGWWAEHADLLEGVPARYDPALLDAAAIGPASYVLDVGSPCWRGRRCRATSGSPRSAARWPGARVT